MLRYFCGGLGTCLSMYWTIRLPPILDFFKVDDTICYDVDLYELQFNYDDNRIEGSVWTHLYGYFSRTDPYVHIA